MENDSCRLNDCNFDVERSSSYLHINLFIVENHGFERTCQRSIRSVGMECWPQRIDRIHTHGPTT